MNPAVHYPFVKNPEQPPQYTQRPSAHIEATKDESVSIGAAVAIDIWSPYSPHGHIAGGIEYNRGTLKVPSSGIYFIYCQIWFNPSPNVGRYYVKKNGADIIMVSQSIKGTKTEGNVVANGCFPLNKGDIIHVELTNPHRVWNGPGHCYLGMYMI